MPLTGRELHAPSMRALMRWALIVLLACAVRFAAAATIWLADDARLFHIDVPTGIVAQTIAVSDIAQLAAASTQAVWAITPTALALYGDGERPIAEVDVAALGYGAAALVAADAYDGSAWVVTARNLLVHVDVRGRLLGAYTLAAPASALAVALDQTVWVAGEQELWHFSRAPTLLGSMPIAIGTARPELLAVDSLADRVWIVTREGFAVVSTHDPPSPALTAKLDGGIRSAALDPRTGTLWLLTAAELIAFGPGAKPAYSIDLTKLGADGARSVTYDALQDAFLLSTSISVVVITRDRTVVGAVPVPEHDVDATPPFRVLPRIALLQPLDKAVVSDRVPAYVVQLAPQCNDAACGVHPAYMDSMRLSVALNGSAAIGAFHFDAGTGQATVVPDVPLQPGPNWFTAQAVDRFGHLSNVIESRIEVLDFAHPSAAAKAGNQAPSVTLVEPANNATFAPGSDITLTANASDSDGTVTRVDFYRGGSKLIGTVTAPPYSVAWKNVPAGSYSLTAKATDNTKGTRTSAAVKVTVAAPPNVPPTIAIVRPSNGAVVDGPGFIVEAMAMDGDGTVTKVEFYDGATRVGTVSGGSATFNATWSYANVSPGNHTLKATATDDAGGIASASVAVVVNGPPLAVLTAPLPCSEIIGPADIALKADAFDQDGEIARVDFFAGDSLLGSATRPPYALVWSGAPTGSHTLTAVAVDDRGASGPSSPVTVTVAPPDEPPAVNLTAPPDGSIFGSGAIVAVAAFASDPDGTVAKVEFYSDGSLIGTVSSAPFAIQWTAPAAGSVALTARAIDDRGAATISAAIHVSLVADDPPTVALTAPSASATFTAPATIGLAAMANDSDGSIAKVEFFVGPAGSTPSQLIGTSSEAPYKATWSNVAGGLYVAVARATDDLGSVTSSAALAIKVNNPPAVTITAPPDNSAFAAQTTIPISIRATDADGAISFIELLLGDVVIGRAVPGGSYSSYTFNANITGAGAGTHIFTGRATDNLGARSTSAPLHVTVSGLPEVALIAPRSGTSFAAPATIDMYATATETLGSIAKVDFYAGTELVASAASAPYGATWRNVPLGVHSLTAVATDATGATAASTPVTITVEPFALNIVSPLPRATIYESSTVVTGTFAGAVPDEVTVNGQRAVLGIGTFAATVTLASGGNTIAVTAAGGGVDATRSVEVYRAEPKAFIFSPVPGERIGDDNVTVEGVVEMPPNSAVFVNGKRATVTPWGRFFANNVPLTGGTNSLVMTAGSQDGPSLQQTLTVASDGPAPFLVEVSPDTGFTLPFTVTVTVTNRELIPYGYLYIDADGDGYAEYKEAGPPTPQFQKSYFVTYTKPGLYRLNVSVTNTDRSLIVFTGRLIQVATVSHLDATVRGVYTGMLDNLRVGNVERALTAVTNTTHDKYAAIFDALGPNLSTVVDQLGAVYYGTFTDDLAEYSIVRNTETGPQGFLIYLIRDPDGIWRIEEM